MDKEDFAAQLQQRADDCHRHRVKLSDLPSIAGREQGIGNSAANFIGYLAPGEMLLIGARASKQGRTLFFNMLKDGFALAGYEIALIPQYKNELSSLTVWQKFAGKNIESISDAEFTKSMILFTRFMKSTDWRAPRQINEECITEHLAMADALNLIEQGCSLFDGDGARVLMVDAFDFMLDDTSEIHRVRFLRAVRRIAKAHKAAVVLTGNTYKRTAERSHKDWPRESLAEEAFYSSTVPYTGCATAIVTKNGAELVASVDVLRDGAAPKSEDFRYLIDWQRGNLAPVAEGLHIF
jgi:hypothetical protein